MDGWHFLQIPGPTNVPQRILRAIAQSTIDHRGKAFGEMGRETRAGLKHVFGIEVRDVALRKAQALSAIRRGACCRAHETQCSPCL